MVSIYRRYFNRFSFFVRIVRFWISKSLMGTCRKCVRFGFHGSAAPKRCRRFALKPAVSISPHKVRQLNRTFRTQFVFQRRVCPFSGVCRQIIIRVHVNYLRARSLYSLYDYNTGLYGPNPDFGSRESAGERARAPECRPSVIRRTIGSRDGRRGHVVVVVVRLLKTFRGRSSGG